jgi:predicted GIY-YIG superfamily endonuclease
VSDNWTWYVLRCADGSLYCGITTDLDRRLDQHNSGRGSKYVWSRRPAVVVLREEVGERSAALKAEVAFKRLSKRRKEEVIRARG